MPLLPVKTVFAACLLLLLIRCSPPATRGTSLPPPELKTADTDTLAQAPVPALAQLVFGYYCGECGGNCAPMFRLNMQGNAATLWADYENGFFREKEAIPFRTDLNRRDKIELAYEVARKLPEQLLDDKAIGRRYGCPDCTDGCGVYVELTRMNGIGTQKFYLDHMEADSIPREITDFARFVRKQTQELMK